MYITAQLIVEGALDEDVQFETEEQFDSWLDDIKEQESNSATKLDWEVFRIVHDHPLTNECMCVQYLTDHHPYWTNEAK
jgi:hypothetical protein